MTTQRFKYSEHSQMITDSVTDYTYYGNQEVCDLLNELSERGDKIIESFTTKELLILKWKLDIYRNFAQATMRILENHNIETLHELEERLKWDTNTSQDSE